MDDFGVIIPSVSLGGSPKEGIKVVLKACVDHVLLLACTLLFTSCLASCASDLFVQTGSFSNDAAWDWPCCVREWFMGLAMLHGTGHAIRSRAAVWRSGL